jgi:hypothetical protein
MTTLRDRGVAHQGRVAIGDIVETIGHSAGGRRRADRDGLAEMSPCRTWCSARTPRKSFTWRGCRSRS